MWGLDMKAQRSLKTGTDSCKARDLWITHFVPLQLINKIALAFTSKEIGESYFMIVVTHLAANSKHWFTTSFLQPLPYLVTP